MAEETNLIVGTDLTAVDLYTEVKINALMKDIEKKALAVKLPDASTDKGRKEIIAHAFKATKTKTMIVDGAQNITEDWRKKTKSINGVKKIADVFLSDLAKKIRQPVTDWEKAEEERTMVTAECLRYFTMARMVAAGTSSEVIMTRIKEVHGYKYHEVLDTETKESLHEEKKATLETLHEIHVDAVTAEEEKAELDQLRKEKEERESKAKAEEEEKKRLEEEEEAKKARIAKDEQDERDRLAYKKRIQKEEQEKAEKKIADEKREREVAAKKEREEEEARIADVNHRESIKQEAINSILSLELTDESTAYAIVDAISQDQIDNISIKY